MNLEDLTIPVLKKLIRAYNLHTVIKGYSKMNKIDLIKNIKKHFSISDNNLLYNEHSDLNVSEELKYKQVRKAKTTTPEIKKEIKKVVKEVKKELSPEIKKKLKEVKEKKKFDKNLKEKVKEQKKQVEKVIVKEVKNIVKKAPEKTVEEAVKEVILQKPVPEIKKQNKSEYRQKLYDYVNRDFEGTERNKIAKNIVNILDNDLKYSKAEYLKKLYENLKQFFRYSKMDGSESVQAVNIRDMINDIRDEEELKEDKEKKKKKKVKSEEATKSELRNDYEIIKEDEIIEPDIIKDVLLSKSAEGMGFIKCPEREYIFRKNTQFLKIVDEIINTLNKSAYKYAYSSKSKYEKQINDFFKQYYDELKQMKCINKDDDKIYTLCIQAGETIPNHLRNLTTGGANFYPTPSVCVNRFEKQINNGTNILEGTAGMGHILNDIRGIKYKIGDNDYYMMKAVEYDNILASYLTIMNPDVEVGHGDFLKLKPDALKGVDLIILNPPFTSGSNKNYYFDFLFKALYLLRSSTVHHPELIFISPPIVDEREVSNRYGSTFYLYDILDYLPKTLLKKYEKEYNFSGKDNEIDNLEFVQGNLLGHCSEFSATKFKASIYSFIGYV